MTTAAPVKNKPVNTTRILPPTINDTSGITIRLIKIEYGGN